MALKLSSDDQLEQSFFQLAFQQLQDKLKNLLPYLIGFEIVNKNDDNTKALGVFGFKSNQGQILFVPVFFINGSIKGMDLLYSKNNEQFYPLNEDFAEMFLKDDSTTIGNPSKETRSTIQQDNSSFDMRNMAVPPRTGKYTYASVIDYVKDADNNTKRAFHNLIKKSADFTESLLRYYPLEKIAEAVVELGGDSYRKDNGVRILNTGETYDFTSLDKDQKEQLATKGFIVIDKRDESKKSKFVPINLKLKFTNPSETGFYPYLTAQGEIKYGLVLVKPDQLQVPYTTDDSIVVDLDPSNDGQAYLCDTKQLFVKDQIVISDYSEVYKKFENPADVKPSFGDSYVLINESLKATQPFKITANFKDASGVRKLKVEVVRKWEDQVDDIGQVRRGQDRPGSIHNIPQGNFRVPQKKEADFYVVLTKMIGNKLTRKNDTVYIPAGFKLLKVNIDRPYGNIPTAEGSTEAPKRREDQWLEGKPGNINTLDSALCERKVYPMTVRHNGSEYFVSVKDVKKKYENDRMAKIGMVTELGLDWKEASAIIEGISNPGRSNAKIEGYLKVADLGDYPAQPIEETPYINEFGQPTYSGVGTENQAPLDHSYNDDPTRMGLGVRPDIEGIDGEIDKANQLSQNGQKSIFDTHTIATLAKYVEPSDKINEYLPTFLSALDELGRLLFLAHGEIEKFVEMYGRDDLPKFVELITDVFKNLGELIIFLKRKSPEISINSGKKDALDV